MLAVTGILRRGLASVTNACASLVTSSDSGGAMRKHRAPGATGQSAIPDLTLMDTCDQCGAAACVRVAVTDAQQLDFCGHHYDEHAMALLAAGYRVLDGRGLVCGD
jgi:hypothetical protein